MDRGSGWGGGGPESLDQATLGANTGDKSHEVTLVVTIVRQALVAPAASALNVIANKQVSIFLLFFLFS